MTGDLVGYRIEHQTRYDYAAPVSTSQHVACLRPRELPLQRVLDHAIAIEPTPALARHRLDYFGNHLDHLTVLQPHRALVVTGRSHVVLRARPPIDPAASPAWEAVRDALAFRRGSPPAEGAQFAYASPYVVRDPALAAFAADSFRPGRPMVEAAVHLMHRIHSEFAFDPAATTLTTPVTRVLAEKRGVCQDFAHLQISCLRSLGLPARYVSGYLLTDPPPGQPRLVGADASHAWLSIACPVHGWIDLDPTNDVVGGVRHVTVAWGRDYGDVSPLRGVILGGGQHKLTVAVSVLPDTQP